MDLYNLETAAPTTRYLSDMTWSSMTNGWGPVEKDKTNGDSAAGDGGPIKLRGTVYPKGLGAHAPSDVRYLLGGNCSTFTAQVGVDDDTAITARSFSGFWLTGCDLRQWCAVWLVTCPEREPDEHSRQE